MNRTAMRIRDGRERTGFTADRARATLRVMIRRGVGGVFGLLAVVGCGTSTGADIPGLERGVYFVGTVRDASRDPVAGATAVAQLVFPAMTPADTVQLGDCRGAVYHLASSAASVATDRSGRFTTLLHGGGRGLRVCAVVTVTPPAGSALRSRVVTDRDVSFASLDAGGDTARFEVVLER